MAGLSLPKVECVETTDTYGRFVAEPIEKGFGVTLGNSIRRVLLSSLPGAAITWVLVEGIQHEFSTIQDLKEDTMDFLLNTTAIRIRPLSQRPGKLTLDVEGERVITAGDIKLTSDFEIANPELHLATLTSANARLSVEFNIELGRGFVSAASNDSLPIGAMPIDAIFTPVSKANFSVERSTLGEDINMEKLVIDIWTDKTITPTEAISQSASILVEQFSCFRELARTMVEEGGDLAWQRLIPPEQYNMPLDQLNLSTHTYNSLRRGGITTLGQILEKSLEGLSSLAGFGAKSKEEVEKMLQDMELPFVPELTKDKKDKKDKKKKEELEDIEGEVDET